MRIGAGIADPVPRGPVRREERCLAPDLARGAMLLFIALANAAGVVFGGQPGSEPNPHGVERAVNLLMFVLVHCRAYPVFAVMFGYGLVQLARRQEAAGATPDQVRSVLLRRNLWLVMFGCVHAVLLYFGDFLGAYGLDGMVAAVVLIPRGQRSQRIVLWIWASSLLYAFVLGALVAVRFFQGVAGQASVPFTVVDSLVAPDYSSSMLARLSEWPVHTATVLPFIMIVWLGIWGGRSRFLEAPACHLKLLRRVAAIGLGIAVAGGLPLGLASAGMLHADPSSMTLIFLLHQVSGMFGGPGFVALFGLAAAGAERASSSPILSRAIGLLAALGQRSLSAYLSQSLAWLLLLAPYTLALGHRFGSPLLTATAIALCVWLASLLGAGVLERRSRRGPAETLLRRLTYK